MVMNIKILQFLLTFLGSFVGQLIVRVTSLDGSLDKWWLLLPPISIPPLSLIPAYLIYSNNIKKGNAGSPYDLYMLIPAISSIIFGLIIEKKFNLKGPKGTLLKFLINFLSISFALYFRDIKKCISDTNNDTVDNDTVNDTVDNDTVDNTVDDTVDNNTDNNTDNDTVDNNTDNNTDNDTVDNNTDNDNKKDKNKKDDKKDKDKKDDKKDKDKKDDKKDKDKKDDKKDKDKKNKKEKFSQLYRFIEQFNTIDEKQSTVSYSKILTQSAIISALLPLMPYIIVKVPYLTSIIRIVGNISPYLSILIDIIIRFLCIILIYICINMYNGRNKDKSCTDTYKSTNVFIIIIISIVINLLVSNKADLIPYNVLELNPPLKIKT